jgi:hypothetical protein
MLRQKAKRMRRVPLMLRRVPLTLVALALLLAAAAACGAIVIAYRAHVLNAESLAFVDKAVPAITTDPSVDQLLNRATPGLRTYIRTHDLPALARAFSRLGPAGEYLGAGGGVNWLSLAGFREPVSASYVAKESFMYGIATFRLTLVKLDGRWAITKYDLDVSLLGSSGPGLWDSPLRRGI